jgi:hypothetical protein
VGDGGGRQHRGEVGPDRLHAPRVQRGDVVVERVDGQPERHRPLVLGRAALEHEHARGRGAVAHGRHQRALADPRLAEHAERTARPRRRLLDGVRRGGELRLAAEQLHRDASLLVPERFLRPQIG